MTQGDLICIRCGRAGHVSASCPHPLPPVHVINAVVPIRIVSEANSRDHWRVVARRKKEHAQATAWTLKAHRPPQAERLTVTLTRIGVKTLDTDNLAGGFKGTRDAVAAWLGIDDGSSRIDWRYAQRTGKTGEYAAEIHIEWSEEAHV